MTKRKQICQKIRRLALPIAKEQKIGYGCVDRGPEYTSWYKDQDRSVHILAGWCGICSMAIAKSFVRCGFDAHVRMGKFFGQYGHCWVYSDGQHYDITAMQFGPYKPVVIVPADTHPTENLRVYYGYMFPSPDYEIDPEDQSSHFSEWHEAYQPTDTKIDQLLEM